jgi:hypothetical protein
MFGAERFSWNPWILWDMGLQQDVICKVSIANIELCTFSLALADCGIWE